MIDIREILDEFDIVDMQNLDIDYGISGEKAGLAVALYNKALKKMNEGCFDLARIDLRKSVNLYPNFSNAVILLGVCVFANGDRSEAVGIFNSVRGEDRERALDYLDRLHEISMRPESAGVRNTVRGSRIPDGVYGNENKLDEIMRKPQNAPIRRAPVYDDIDSDMKIAGGREERDEDDDISVEVSPAPSDIVEENFDDDLDMEVTPVADVEETVRDSEIIAEKDEEKIVETDINYVRTELLGMTSKKEQDTPEEKTEKPIANDDIAPYGTIRRSGRERFERTEGQTSRPANIERRQAVSGQGEARATVAEYKRAAEAAEKKTKEVTAKANKAIANLKMKAARSQVISIVIAIVCLILLITLICVCVSNGKLKDEIAEYENGGTSMGDTNSGSDDNSNSGSVNTDKPADPNAQKAEAKASYDSAKSLYEQGKFYEAAEILIGLDKTLLEAGDATEADKMYRESVSKFIPTYYSNFDSNIGSENWEEVIRYGEPVYKHNADYNSKGSFLCFHLGKAYEFTGNKEKAKEYYNITMTKYPNSSDAGYARYRLQELG